MKKLLFSLAAILFIILSACAPVGSIAIHEFGSGYYNLNLKKKVPQRYMLMFTKILWLFIR